MTTTEVALDLAGPDAEIGERVHQLMWRRRVSQTVFAREVGMTQSALSRKIRGERPWYTAELIAAAQSLGVTVGYLFGEDGPTPIGVNAQPRDYKSVVSGVVSIDSARSLRAFPSGGAGVHGSQVPA